jgi:transcriptional regulator with XRE-family HTH domain
MPKVRPIPKKTPARHFIRSWRKHRGLTLEQLAERVGVTHGALSQLERGEVNYTQPMLEALAYALMCSPADLVVRDPTDTSAPWSILDGLSKADKPTRERILRVVQELLKDGTNS